MGHISVTGCLLAFGILLFPVFVVVAVCAYFFQELDRDKIRENREDKRKRRGRKKVAMTNKEIEQTEGLTWRQAYYAMLSGKRVKRSGWEGYWVFEQSPRGDFSVMMHVNDTEITDIRDTLNVPYTLANTTAKDWMVDGYKY